MAMADYHLCDKCGAKTFYDADIPGEWVGDEWRYNWQPGGENYPPFAGYRAYALCHSCEKTHEIKIVARSDGPLESGEGE